jgi:hypothetical protein
MGKTISSLAAETVVLSTEEAGRIRRTSTPDQLRERRASAKRARRGSAILRDAWLAPLTLEERGKPGPQASSSKVRAERQGLFVDVAEGLLGTAEVDREPSSEFRQAERDAGDGVDLEAIGDRGIDVDRLGMAV